MDNDNTHEANARQSAVCLLGHPLARQRENLLLFEIQPARSTFFRIARALGPVMMMLGLVIMPLIPDLILFFLATTLIAFGVGTTNTTIPSFVSKRTSETDRGRVLGVNQSIRSIAQVLGPLVGGLMFEQAGLSAHSF